MSEIQARSTGWHLLFAALVLGLFAYNLDTYWFLGDDGFIAFRYARNLVDGHGLVFNPGDHVEGYTQPLWILVLAGGMAVGWQPETFACVAGITCGAVILATLVWFTRRLDPRAGLWVWFAPLCLAVNRTFCAWSTSGLGSQFFAMLVLLGAVRFVVEWEDRKRPLGSGVLFAVATLARPEGGLFLATAGLFLVFDVLVSRRRPLLSLLWYGLPGVLLVGTHFLWRHAYYGYWLPNTFYAKVSGFWWEQSSKYLWLFVREQLLFVVLPLLLVLFRRGPIAHWLFLGFLAVYTTYVVYVGGDRHEFRFMTPLLPMLYWLLQSAVRQVQDRLASVTDATGGALGWLRDRLTIRIGARTTAVLLAVLVVASSGYSTLHSFTFEDNVSDVFRMARFARGRAKEGKFFKRLVDEGYLQPTDLIAARAVGAMPYYSGLPTLDLHGLCDPHIAHQPIQERGVVAHEKVASLEYVLERAPLMVNVHNLFVYKDVPWHVLDTDLVPLEPYFPEPIRMLHVFDEYVVFGTPLDEQAYRERFARFEIMR